MVGRRGLEPRTSEVETPRSDPDELTARLATRRDKVPSLPKKLAA